MVTDSLPSGFPVENHVSIYVRLLYIFFLIFFLDKLFIYLFYNFHGETIKKSMTAQIANFLRLPWTSFILSQCSIIFLFSIIFYWLCYYSCPNFSSFVPLHPAPPTPSGNSTPLSMSMGHVRKSFDYSISYTVLYIPLAIL